MAIQSLFDEGDALFDTFFVDIVDLDSGADVTHQDLIVECGLVVGFEAIDVFLGEEDVFKVEQIQVVLQQLGRQFIIKVAVRVMLALKHVGDMHGDLAEIGVTGSWGSVE